jgi:hypothetical protein
VLVLVAHLYFRTFCARLDVSGTTRGARSHAIGQIGLMLKFIRIYLWCAVRSALSALVNFDERSKTRRTQCTHSHIFDCAGGRIRWIPLFGLSPRRI